MTLGFQDLGHHHGEEVVIVVVARVKALEVLLMEEVQDLKAQYLLHLHT